MKRASMLGLGLGHGTCNIFSSSCEKLETCCIIFHSSVGVTQYNEIREVQGHRVGLQKIYMLYICGQMWTIFGKFECMYVINPKSD